MLVYFASDSLTKLACQGKEELVELLEYTKGPINYDRFRPAREGWPTESVRADQLILRTQTP